VIRPGRGFGFVLLGIRSRLSFSAGRYPGDKPRSFFGPEDVPERSTSRAQDSSLEIEFLTIGEGDLPGVVGP